MTRDRPSKSPGAPERGGLGAFEGLRLEPAASAGYFFSVAISRGMTSRVYSPRE